MPDDAGSNPASARNRPAGGARGPVQDNPTLMRLRELEVLEKVVASGKLTVVLGDKGLADKVVNLL